MSAKGLSQRRKIIKHYSHTNNQSSIFNIQSALEGHPTAVGGASCQYLAGVFFENKHLVLDKHQFWGYILSGEMKHKDICWANVSGVLRNKGNQRGMSLVLVMAIFVALGIIAVAFLTTSTTEVRMSKYAADSKTAFHAAEAGLALCIARIPGDLTAFPAAPDTWALLANQAGYKSGPSDTVPVPIELSGTQYLIGFSVEQGSEFYGYIYDLLTSGKKKRSRREIKAKVRCGPIPGGTQY
jgi:hypothetical protein